MVRACCEENVPRENSSLIQARKHEGPLINSSSSDNPCTEAYSCTRPHVLYNYTTGGYILWVRTQGSYRVATSSSPSSAFSFRPGLVTIDPSFEGQLGDFGLYNGGNIILPISKDRCLLMQFWLRRSLPDIYDIERYKPSRGRTIRSALRNFRNRRLRK